MGDKGNGNKGGEYFTVSEIIDPDLIKLSNGLQVRLLGIKPNYRKKQAMEFLSRKILNCF